MANKPIEETGILKEIKTPKEGLFYCVFLLDNNKVIETGGFTKQAPAPNDALVGKRCKFKYTLNGQYINLYPKFKGKKVVAWEIEQLSEDICQPEGDPPPPAPSPSAVPTWQETKDRKIIRQSCLKAAAQVVANNKTTDITEATTAVINMTKEFVKYVNEIGG